MTLPTNERCQKIVKELVDDPGLSEWESAFINSCAGRTHFTDLQREKFAELESKFDL